MRKVWITLTSAMRLALATLTLAACAPAHAGPLSFSDLLARPRPKADAHIAFGPGPRQFGELWLPAGKGPHPVVVLIHGGCWQAALPGTELVDFLANDLRRRGIAVWNIDYARLGDANGGYPDTFLDAGRGVDYLRVLARTHDLDLSHVVAVGHSAGGHLAVWAAGRKTLNPKSPLHTADPLPIQAVVSLAGINDLAAYRARGPDACGGLGTIDALVGAGHRHVTDLYADTSPSQMVPTGVKQYIVSGALDPIVPHAFGEAYAAKAKAAGDPAQAITIPGAGHFELIDPMSAAWKQIVAVIEREARGR